MFPKSVRISTRVSEREAGAWSEESSEEERFPEQCSEATARNKRRKCAGIFMIRRFEVNRDGNVIVRRGPPDRGSIPGSIRLLCP